MAETRIVTGKVTMCYEHVFEPTAIDESSTPKYSLCIVISKDDKKTISAIENAINAVKEANKAKLGDKNGKIPQNLRTPLRDGDIERYDDPVFINSYFINASSVRKPQVVDADCNPILSKDDFYSGCIGRVSINFFAYNVEKSKGIGAGLCNIQKLEDGERLDGGKTAEQDFGDYLI